MLPEEKARIKIDKQLIDADWDIVARKDCIPILLYQPVAYASKVFLC